MGQTVFTGAIALALCLVHLYSYRLKFLGGTPRNAWLSISSGISLAYVFVHILPELTDAQQDIPTLYSPLGILEHHVYIVALVGMLGFYGLERVAAQSQQDNESEGKGSVTAPGIFWLQTLSFALFNLLIGYLLHYRKSTEWTDLLIYGIAIGTHFVVNDYGLRQDNRSLYQRLGRWILAGAIVTGWVIGLQLSISTTVTALIFSLLAGSIVLNVIKEELPDERQSNFLMLSIGALGYTFLLLLV